VVGWSKAYFALKGYKFDSHLHSSGNVSCFLKIKLKERR